jgi:hypothetical protein
VCGRAIIGGIKVAGYGPVRDESDEVVKLQPITIQNSSTICAPMPD